MAKKRRREKPVNMKLVAAIGRTVLGMFLGGVAWFFLATRHPLGVGDAWHDWFFNPLVIAGFILGGGVFGLIVGNRFFEALAKNK